MRTTADFAETAWLTVPRYKPHEIVNGPGTLVTRREGPAYEIDAELERDSWVVISDTKWPGWRAYIDGRRVETHYANHAFLGVYVPAGHHRVRLIYLPEPFTRGRAISFTTLALLAISALTRAAIRARRRALRPA